jgi:hypothetical protein
MSMRGRPPKPKSERRGNMIRVLLTDGERKAIESAARSKSMDVSTWMRVTLLEVVGYRK